MAKVKFAPPQTEAVPTAILDISTDPFAQSSTARA
jgi:hypothetical protein